MIVLAWIFWSGCSTKVDDEGKYSGPLFSENIRATEARTPQEELAGFKLPPGFEIQLFASEPDIQKPMNLAFDAQGRMWVTQSFDYPIPAAMGKGTDRITILEDSDGDGRADKFTHFNDTLNIPIGLLPLNDGVIAFSIPNVYKFNDNNNDGKQDNQKVMLGPFGYTDTHGMVSNFIRGFDGWVHACHGFTNDSRVAGADGDSIRMISGNTFRFRIDGSRVEQTTFGQVNPFGLAYDESGYIYSTDSHSSPLYQLIIGGDYPHFGKIEIMAFGPDMKPLVDEATALCGITYYADGIFPMEFRDNLFIGDVINSRVHRYSYVNQGSSPVGKSEIDFVKSADPWFRPVNIKLGPDGAIYISDFYNRIIGHYEVPLGHPQRDKNRGRIWRITYKGKQHARKNLLTATTDELISILDDDNLTIRFAAANQLVDRIGPAAVDAVGKVFNNKDLSVRQYVQSLWILQRLHALTPDLIQKSATHASELIRLHTMRILGEEKSDREKVYPMIVQALEDKDPHVVRAAVELLMKYPEMSSLESVLTVLNETPATDSHLIYTAKLCLRNLLRNEPLLIEVASKEWKPGEVVFIESVLVDVYSRDAGIFLAKHMAQNPLQGQKMGLAYQQIARFAPPENLDAVIAEASTQSGLDVDVATSMLRGIRQGIAQRGGKESATLQKWGAIVAESILKKYPSGFTPITEETISRQKFAADLAGDYKVASMVPFLEAFLMKGSQDHLDVKAAAFTALSKISPEKSIELAGSLLNDSVPLGLRKKVATELGKFSDPAANKVLASVKNAPADLQSAIAVSLASSSEGKGMLFDKIKKGEFSARILIEPSVEERVLLNITRNEQKTYDELTTNVGEISKEKEALIEARVKSYEASHVSSIQLDSGRAVFNMYCNACHQRIGVPSIGPQLNGIGARGARALTEKILDPNRNISEAFRNYTIKMKDGKVLSGIYRREEGAVMVFADLAGKEFSVTKKDIQEKKASRYTIMPDNFGTTISEDDFNELLTYLINS